MWFISMGKRRSESALTQKTQSTFPLRINSDSHPKPTHVHTSPIQFCFIFKFLSCHPCLAHT